MKHKSVADGAYEILIKHKKPLHYRQITKELTKIRPLTVKEPYYAVNASMSGDKRFMRIKRGVWGLVKWQRFGNGGEFRARFSERVHTLLYLTAQNFFKKFKTK